MNVLVTHQEIVRGDDYKAIDGRALSWFSPDWPNLAGATLTMVVGHIDPNIPTVGGMPAIVWTGAVPSSPETRQALLELTALQTKQAPVGALNYQLTATLVDGDRATLAIGWLSVQSEPGSTPSLPSP